MDGQGTGPYHSRAGGASTSGGGQTNRQIARILFISEKTASIHVSNIMGKLGAANGSEAGVIAHRLRLLEPNA